MENKTKKETVIKSVKVGNWLVALWEKGKSQFLIGVISMSVPILYYNIISGTNRELAAKDRRIYFLETQINKKDSILISLPLYYQVIIDKKDSVHNVRLQEVIRQQQIIKDKIEKM